MKKVLCVLLCMTMIITVFAGCGSTPVESSAPAPESQEAAPEPEASGDTPTLNLLFVSHTFVDTITPLIPEFEAQHNVKVNMETYAETAAFEKLLADLSSGTGVYDVFMTSPVYLWQYATGGWIEPLDDYVNDESKTPAEWDIDDFVPGILNSCRWTGEPLTGVTEGNLWALPINYESYMLAYRPSLLEKYGVEVPETYEELAEIVTSLSGQDLTDDNGNTIYPIVTRFDKYWDLTYLTFGTMLQTYGVQLLDSEGNVAIDSPASVEATEMFVKMIQEGSPEGAGLFTWYEALQGFASGQYMFSFNEADGFASTYENPESSAISDDVGYAPTLLGPDGTRSASFWVWSLGMNSASKNKDLAWQFMQWATSKETMLKTNLAGNMNPVRSSAWEDEEMVSMVNSWGEYEGQYLEVMREMADVSTLVLPAHPEITRVLDMWAEAVQSAYYGQSSVQDALTAAAPAISDVLK